MPTSASCPAQPAEVITAASESVSEAALIRDAISQRVSGTRHAPHLPLVGEPFDDPTAAGRVNDLLDRRDDRRGGQRRVAGLRAVHVSEEVAHRARDLVVVVDRLGAGHRAAGEVGAEPRFSRSRSDQ